MPSKTNSDFTTLIIKGLPLDYGQETSSDGKILTLKNPKTSDPAKFYFIDNMLHELVFHATESSCFIDDTVENVGKFIFSSPVDPIFLVLPYFKDRPYDYMTLDEVLTDKEYPNLSEIKSCIGFKYLNFAVDTKDNKYKYNEDKIVEWIGKKYEQLLFIMERKHLTPGTTASKETLGIISQYIEPQIYQMFLASQKSSQKRKSSPNHISTSTKKQKH